MKRSEIKKLRNKQIIGYSQHFHNPAKYLPETTVFSSLMIDTQ